MMPLVMIKFMSFNEEEEEEVVGEGVYGAKDLPVEVKYCWTMWR